MEPCGSLASVLDRCPNVEIAHEVVRLHLGTPTATRVQAEVLGIGKAGLLKEPHRTREPAEFEWHKRRAGINGRLSIRTKSLMAAASKLWSEAGCPVE
jgi:hypothetical protein